MQAAERSTMVTTVMVVDDDEDIRDLLEAALTDEGYGVCTAHDGQDALNAIAGMNPGPSVVLLDMMMPRMNGNQFLAAVAKMPALADVPIIVVSAAPGKVRGNAARVVTKPVDLDVLLRAVAECCPRETGRA